MSIAALPSAYEVAGNMGSEHMVFKRTHVVQFRLTLGPFAVKDRKWNVRPTADSHFHVLLNFPRATRTPLSGRHGFR